MEQEVVIQISNPEQKSEIGGVNKYFVYTIRGKDSKGQIDISRRYSDFTLLRQILVKRWPGFYIPSLPEKKTIGSDDKIFVESRRRGLEYFLLTLSQNQRLWNSEEMVIFLRNNAGDSDKQLSPLLKENFEKLLGRYKQAFPNYSGKQGEKDHNGKILQFNSYLKGSKPILQKLSEMTQKMHELTKRAFEKKLILLQFLLPDYEKNCLLENDEKKKTENFLFLCAQTNGISQSIEKFKSLHDYPPVLIISEEIRRERHQIQAFEDLLKIREDYEANKSKATAKVKDIQIDTTKINAGKESFFSKIKKVSKQEQLAANQKQLQKAKAEQKNWIIICQIISNIIAVDEIDRFKQKRQKAYYNLLKKYAKQEKELSEGQIDIWTQVGRHDWIALQEENQVLVKKDIEEDYKPKMEVISQTEEVLNQNNQGFRPNQEEIKLDDD